MDLVNPIHLENPIHPGNPIHLGNQLHSGNPFPPESPIHPENPIHQGNPIHVGNTIHLENPFDLVNPIVDQADGGVDRDLEVEADDRDLGDRDPEEESGENFQGIYLKEIPQIVTRQIFICM